MDGQRHTKRRLEDRAAAKAAWHETGPGAGTAALPNTDRQLATILESVSDAFVALDDQWRYTYVNRRAGELFGRRPEDLVGKHIWTEFPEGIGQPFYHAYQKAAAERVSVQLEEWYAPWDRWFENRIYPTEGGLAIYFTDITERKRAEMLLTGQKRVLELIATGAPLHDTLDALLRVIEGLSQGMLASVLLLDADGVHVRHGAAPSLPAAFTAAIDGAAIGERAGSCSTAAFRRAPVVVEDITTDPLWEDYRDLAAAHGLRACWSAPIFDPGQRVVGTFALYFRTPRRPADQHLKLIEMATHTAAIAIVRKREEEALRASEARYRGLVEISPDAIWINRQGRIAFTNAAGVALVGAASRDEVVGRSPLELLHPDDHGVVLRRIAEILGGQPASAREATVVRLDGRQLAVEVLATRMTDADGPAIQVILRDITERKQSERELREAHEFTRQIVTSAQEGLLVLDREFRFRLFNPYLERLSGQAASEVLGRRPWEIFPAVPESLARPVLARALGGQTVKVPDFRIAGAAGQVSWTSATCSPLSGTNLESAGVLVSLQDVTERKQAEEGVRALAAELEARVAERTGQLEAATRAAQYADRLKSAFLATMSHELRTPLNSIIGFTGVLLQGLAGPLNEEQSTQMGMVRDSARHLLALINDVLDISKIEAGQLELVREDFDIRSAIESVLRAMAPHAQKKGLVLVAAVESPLPRIVSDRRRVEQILLNLLSNAVKFSERGEVRLECRMEGPWMTLGVSDHGIGIRPEDLDKLFEPFQQLDTGLNRRHEGTGLGLSICRNLVTMLGGEIRVKSAWNVGSTFSFTLPLET